MQITLLLIIKITESCAYPSVLQVQKKLHFQLAGLNIVFWKQTAQFKINTCPAKVNCIPCLMLFYVVFVPAASRVFGLWKDISSSVKLTVHTHSEVLYNCKQKVILWGQRCHKWLQVVINNELSLPEQRLYKTCGKSLSDECDGIRGKVYIHVDMFIANEIIDYLCNCNCFLWKYKMVVTLLAGGSCNMSLRPPHALLVPWKSLVLPVTAIIYFKLVASFQNKRLRPSLSFVLMCMWSM